MFFFCKRIWIQNIASAHCRTGDEYGAFLLSKPDDDLKYNEGALVGEWVKFPTTAEELQKVFERIGIGSKDDFGHPYEEWFITDYRIMNDAT